MARSFGQFLVKVFKGIGKTRKKATTEMKKKESKVAACEAKEERETRRAQVALDRERKRVLKAEYKEKVARVSERERLRQKRAATMPAQPQLCSYRSIKQPVVKDLHDYLGEAAEAGHKAKAAIKNGSLDEAWGYLNEQKLLYMRHSAQTNFTKAQALSLDSQVHENLANILRLEKKDNDALTHILYWVIASRDKPIKRHEQKLKVYFNRCKYKNTSLNEAIRFSKSKTSRPDLRAIQAIVAEWKILG